MNGINLIMGLPGSGKTILCQQFIFACATEKRPALYLSTVSEPFEKILRYAQTLSFFDRAAIGRSVFYEDLGPTVAGEGGLTAVTEHIAALIKERRPGIIAIDSFKALAAFADDARGFRRFLHDLAALLTAFPATTLLDRGIRRGRDAHGAGVRGGRRDHLARDRARERAHATPDPGRASCAEATSAQDATPIASPRTASRSSPGSPIPSARMTTGSAKTGSRPASRRSTRCSPRATHRAAPRWWPGHRAPARP